jgi:hypothetical protein
MKVDTTTLLLVGVGLAAIYFITSKPAVTTVPITPVYRPPVTNAGNSTAQDIAAGTTGAAAILDAINNLSSDD